MGVYRFVILSAPSGCPQATVACAPSDCPQATVASALRTACLPLLQDYSAAKAAGLRCAAQRAGRPWRHVPQPEKAGLLPRMNRFVLFCGVP
ncbi:MAG: hypothetical protein ABJN57_09165 [Hyphomicrobiales bacterium]